MSIEIMSSRERLMAALLHQETDRVPWSPLICGYYSLGLQEPLHGNDLAVQRAIGADVMERISTTVYSQSLPSGIPPAFEISPGKPFEIVTSSNNVAIREIREGNLLLRMYETPVGDVRETYETRESSPWMAFPVEYKIKTHEDLNIYQYIVEAQEYQPAYNDFIRISGEIGDDGLATTPSPISPFQMLLEVELGVEQFHYFLIDYPDELEALMWVMHAKNLEACEIIAESPAEVVILYENTSTSYMSPPMFKRYILDHLNEYADLYHKAGKIVLIHACGTLKDIAAELGLGRYDGVCDIAPPPTGDLDLAEAKEVWGNRKVAMGGIDATAFVSLSPEEMKKHVRQILERISSHRGVILGSGDAVPPGTPLETLRAVTEAVNEFKL
jgi:uroporphyrinogen-III decarboxylase